MAQDEKSLLLKDLCARLPYHPIVRVSNGKYCEDIRLEPYIIADIDRWSPVPYLRPVSSMTEEEMDRLFDILRIDRDGEDDDWIKINAVMGIKFFFQTGKWAENVAEAYDYLNSIHIDYRDLREKGFALEAHEGMY